MGGGRFPPPNFPPLSLPLQWHSHPPFAAMASSHTQADESEEEYDGEGADIDVRKHEQRQRRDRRESVSSDEIVIDAPMGGAGRPLAKMDLVEAASVSKSMGYSRGVVPVMVQVPRLGQQFRCVPWSRWERTNERARETHTYTWGESVCVAPTCFVSEAA